MTTLDQLPPKAATYYSTSTRNDIFEYHLIGTDDLGRRVYQKYFDGEPYGQPRALMTYVEYRRSVNEWVSRCSTAMGVSRWVTPYYRN